MALQVFGTPATRRNKAKEFQDIIHAGIGGASKVIEGNIASRKQKEDDEAIKEAYGIDLKGLNEKERLAVLSSELKTKGQEKLLAQKQENTRTALDRLGLGEQLRGQGQQQEQPGITGEAQGMPEIGAEQGGLNEQIGGAQQPPQQKRSAADIPDSEIAQLSSVDPQLGNLVQKMKDTAIRQKQEEEKAIHRGKELKQKADLEQERHKEKRVDRSYEVVKPFIDQTTKSYKSWETETKPRLNLLSKLSTNEDLINPTAHEFLERLGIPLGALDNPESELYKKTSLDLLRGLPEAYGNRILKTEVDNFLQTIPTLSNSPEGRRMIASNLLKLGEMKEVYYNSMRNLQGKYLQDNEEFPRDFEQQVFEHSKPMLDQINNDFIKMSEIKHVPKDHVPFFSPLGEIKFVPKDKIEWAEKNGGRRIW